MSSVCLQSCIKGSLFSICRFTVTCAAGWLWRDSGVAIPTEGDSDAGRPEVQPATPVRHVPPWPDEHELPETLSANECRQRMSAVCGTESCRGRAWGTVSTERYNLRQSHRWHQRSAKPIAMEHLGLKQLLQLGNWRLVISWRSRRCMHRCRLHWGNRELRPGTHARTRANVAFCPGTFHGCALIF